MEEQTLLYLVVENGVIVNRCVGTIDTSYDNWIKETYPTHIGWKYNNHIQKFIPSSMTTEEFNSLKTIFLDKLNEQKNFYTSYVGSVGFKTNLTEEKQTEVKLWLENLNKQITTIENDLGYLIPYEYGMVSGVRGEPFSMRPNTENEV